MLETSIQTLGNPATFDLELGDPMYWTERLSWELSKNLYTLANAGYKFRQAVSTDYSSTENALNTFATSFFTWYDEAVDDSNRGDPIATPPALPVLKNYMSGELTAQLIKAAIQILLRWIQKQLEHDTEADEVAQVLKKGLIGLAGGEEYSFIELLQNTPLEIRITKQDELEDITYVSD